MQSISRPRGRPRSEPLHRAILDATAHLIGEGGYSALTIEKVAERAAVARQTVYRRWPTKLALVIDLLGQVSESAPLPDTGSVSSDLHALYRRYSKAIMTSGGPIMPGLVAESLYNEELARIVRAYLMKRRAAAIALIERGVERGEIAPDVKPELLIDLLSGFAWYRRIIAHIPINEKDGGMMVDILLNGAARKSRRSPKRAP
jgi:AcrR family transcriptional regulator